MKTLVLLISLAVASFGQEIIAPSDELVTKCKAIGLYYIDSERNDDDTIQVWVFYHPTDDAEFGSYPVTVLAGADFKQVRDALLAASCVEAFHKFMKDKLSYEPPRTY